MKNSPEGTNNQIANLTPWLKPGAIHMLFCALVLLLFSACARNHAPVISSIECKPETRSAGTLFTLKVNAADEDGDPLTYQWSAAEGTFTTETGLKEVQWRSPVNGAGKTIVVTVQVSDAEEGATKDFPVTLGEPDLGCAAGMVNFTNFNLPIAEVTVTIGDRSGKTDENGYSFLDGIAVGNYVMTAGKADYTTFTQAIKVLSNDTLFLPFTLNSIKYSTKASGIITDQDGQPVEGASVMVLNTDGTESKLKAVTSATGFYRLWYIPHGNRTLVVWKEPTDDYSWADLVKYMNFSETESQIDLVMDKTLLHGTFTDSRDNHVYSWRIIGSNTWMAENLAWLPAVNAPDKLSEDEARYYVYDYSGTDTAAARDNPNYVNYGVLYNWQAAQTACPPGWHLPGYHGAWTYLLNALGKDAGKKLKYNSGWTNQGNGDNSSKFSALPAGRVSSAGKFEGVRDQACFWTSSINSQWYLYVQLIFDSDYAYAPGFNQKPGFSVRCVKDD
jgi:uncharacterized protein (TIGR02145 family)